MPKYAFFNPADNTVLQWIDTDELEYNLPDASLLHECAESEWSQRNSGKKMVSGGQIVDYVPPTIPLETLKADKVAKIKAAAAAFITGGMECDALGVVHTYPTAQTDQINLNGLISKALIEGEAGAPYKFWCTSVNGIWARRDHTAAQIKSVGVTVAAHVINAQNAYADKLAAIDAATSQAELDAITESL